MVGKNSVQVFGRKKTAVAVALIKGDGKGMMKVNGCPIELLEPEILRVKVFEPLLLLGPERFAGVDVRIRVRGGGYTSQIYAIRQAIAKGIVAYYQKYVDEVTKKEIKDLLLSYDRSLLVADPAVRAEEVWWPRCARTLPEVVPLNLFSACSLKARLSTACRVDTVPIVVRSVGFQHAPSSMPNLCGVPRSSSVACFWLLLPAVVFALPRGVLVFFYPAIRCVSAPTPALAIRRPHTDASEPNRGCSTRGFRHPPKAQSRWMSYPSSPSPSDAIA
eukprot:TRINITY_DN676_c0_g1_i5.p1 TRINITY_DN676_c0_g1~~TRINITY_DN676_c0_g1_i5.p1  ORF type:complete len:321 (-),score=25.22 TRINITY_DN676_c0_g1_i5:326-1150(-)